MPRCRFAPKRSLGVTFRKEPFRLFFPCGILASVIGVSLWPLVYAGWLTFFPGEAHARLMIEGFVGAFAIGFLGTAFPKMIESPSLTWTELSILLASHLGCVVAHTCGKIPLGDGLFLFTWLFMIGCLLVRLAFFRKDLPPPGFILAGMGLLTGVTGVAMILIEQIVTPTMFQHTLARLFLYEGFLLGPIIGIGGFLFPRFFHSDDSRGQRQPTWQRRAMTGGAVGMFVLGTYITQSYGFDTSSSIARAVVVSVYLLTQVCPFRRGRGTGSLSTMLRAAIAFLLLGIFVSGVSAVFQTAVKHVMFVGGYGLIALTIATRVSWGHSGNINLTEGKRRSLRFILAFILLAMATRIVADFIPTIRVSHHIYAALSWVIAAAIWSWAVMRYVRFTDPKDGC